MYFQHLWKIKSNYFNENLKVIGNNAFAGCGIISVVNIPEGVTKIKRQAFADCVSITKLTVPSTVTGIGEDAFMFVDSKNIVNNSNCKII